jgi:hypothetical protein
MKTDKLEELIDGSDLNQMQKNITKGFILRAKEDLEEVGKDRKLIEETYSKDMYFDIILSTEEVKIFKIKNSKNKWDVKYPYRSIFLKDKGKWERVSTVSPSLDIAFLNYLGLKYDGYSTRFADFAMRMLEIKIEE